MAAKGLNKGVFITFEGIEGCGKSTHSHLLFKYLKSVGCGCVYTREPGGTKLGEAVRKILLGSDGIKISDLTELLLFEACRAQIAEEVIKPALNKNLMVVCDRFSDATIAYQGYGGKIDLNTIKALDKISTSGLIPDLTILLDIDTIEGLKRARKKGIDRMESKTIAYHNRVKAGYLRLAEKNPGRIKVIEMEGSIDRVQAIVRKEAEFVIRKYKGTGTSSLFFKKFIKK